MANNPYVNKVDYAGHTLMDLTGDTVSPSDVLNGVTFHDRSGTPQTGSLITHNVYDGLDSSSADDALSAGQGKALNDTYKRLIVGAIEATDANNAVEQGIPYYIGEDGSNVPEDWVYIRVLNRDNSGKYISQIAYPMNSQSADKIWFRQKNNSGWGNWKLVSANRSDNIFSSITWESNFAYGADSYMRKNNNVIDLQITTDNSVTIANGQLIATLSNSDYYPKSGYICFSIFDYISGACITNGSIWINGSNGKIRYYGSSDISNKRIICKTTYVI